MNRREVLKATTLMGAALGLAGCGSGSDNLGLSPASAQVTAPTDFSRIFLEPELADDIGALGLSTIFGPVPYLGTDEATHLTYELVVTNQWPRPIRLELLEVLDDNAKPQPLFVAEGEAVALLTTLISGGPDIRELQSSQTAIIYLDVALPQERPIPDVLTHRFRVRDLELDELLPEVLGARTKVRSDIVPPVFAPPALGTNWVSAEACCGKSHHRRGPFALGGEYYLAQRYAIDFIQLDPNGLAFVGDHRNNDNWFVYGKEIRAVADGVVIDTLNSEPDITPYEPVPFAINKQNASGNYVIVDLGNGLSYVVGHMQPGSVRVQVGDRIRTGQPLGLVGNSGNSSAPHLHIHLVSGTDLFQGRGIPYGFDSFRLTGYFPTLDDLLPDIPGPPVNRVNLPPREVRGAYPFENEILDF